jgi:ribosome-associated protein
MRTFRVRGDHITLGQFLKANDFIASGAEVKSFLEVEAVLVNGTFEARRGRKLRAGDRVVVSNVEVQIEAVSPGEG